jgi:hypothetical protein
LPYGSVLSAGVGTAVESAKLVVAAPTGDTSVLGPGVKVW